MQRMNQLNDTNNLKHETVVIALKTANDYCKALVAFVVASLLIRLWNDANEMTKSISIQFHEISIEDGIINVACFIYF